MNLMQNGERFSPEIVIRWSVLDLGGQFSKNCRVQGNFGQGWEGNVQRMPRYQWVLVQSRLT